MNKHFPRALLLLLLTLAPAAPALAAEAAAPPPVVEQRVQVLRDAQASFDCAKARAVDEQIICSDRKLALLDRRMGEIYAVARAALPKAEKDALVQAQRKWLAGHDAACAIPAQDAVPDSAVECFAKRYRARTTELQGMLTHGNVIRELGGTEPWAEENHDRLVESCTGQDVGCCVPGSESAEGVDSSYATFAINGRRYLVFKATYELVFHPPHGAYIREEGDDSGGYGTAPESPVTPAACTVIYAETTPGSGDFSETAYRSDGAFDLAELLTGGTREERLDGQFASDLHTKLAPGDTLTLAPKKGAPRRYTWNAASKWYVQGK